ncbi:MAG: YicC/YloC family endoribonuclease [Bacteroidales bacterium]|nr:YicC/YloC family endoribonuclease [Bacteroidales bacterium]
MIKSMTGFGKASKEIGNQILKTEIKSLNSKQFDANIKIPSKWRELELEIRTILLDSLIKGKIDCCITIETNKGISVNKINEELVKQTYQQLHHLATEIGANTDRLFEYVLSLPEIRNSEVESELSEEEKSIFFSMIKEAILNFNNFRETEGAILEKDFIERINIISNLLKEVDVYEQERCNKIKAKLTSKLKELSIEEINENRLEQEMIYYLEKLDITEEKVRLSQHLEYFKQCMDTEINQGKKLGFIAQEIGREINTLGSKANNADIQTIVVKMKDELEKIKEQLANIL